MAHRITGATTSRHFLRIQDPSEKHLLLLEGTKTLCTTMLWTKDQAQIVHSNLNASKDQDDFISVKVPRGLDPKTFASIMAENPHKDCFFSVSLLRANIFFKAAFIGFDKQGLRFRTPEILFKVQRRKDARFPVCDENALLVQFSDPLFPEETLTKKILDLSASGLSFMILDQEEALFHSGLTLLNLNFALRGRTIGCEAVVKHLKSLPLHSKNVGVKVGVQFKEMRANDAQTIAAFVFDETRKFYSKYFSTPGDL